MSGPRIIFGSGPNGWHSGPANGSFPEINPQMLNDLLGGFGHSMFNPSSSRPTEGRRSGQCPFGSTEGVRGGNTGQQWFGAGPAPMVFSCFAPFGQGEQSEDGDFDWFLPGQSCPNKSKPSKNKEDTSAPKCPDGKPCDTKSEKDGRNRDPLAECFKKCQEHVSKVLRSIHSQWSTVIPLEGFEPQEIKVKVDDSERVARIHALHESEDGDQLDRRETRRVVKLPEDVVTESIKVSYRPSGALLIVGTRRMDKTEAPGEHEMEVEFENEQTSSKKSESTKSEERPMEETDKHGHEAPKAGSEKDAPKDVPIDSKQNEEDVETLSEVTVIFPSDDESDDVSKTFILLPKDGKDEGEEARKEPFSVELDVSKFSPENVSVRVVGTNLTVTAEEEEEHGGIHTQRKLQRTFALPSNFDPKALKSTISSDGVLKVLAPEISTPEAPQEKSLPIELK